MAVTTYQPLYNTLQQSAIHDQTYIAVLSAARAVFVESGGTTDHANRLAWATRVITSPEAQTQHMVAAVITDANVQNALPTPTDAVVLTAVNAALNVLADAGL